jgi:hypothetical protein
MLLLKDTMLLSEDSLNSTKAKPCIRNNSDLQRWIYILRYSCFKTLAQKYRTKISGVFKKFGIRLTENSRKTIQVTVEISVGDKTYEKNWTLWTYKDLLKVVSTKQRWALRVEAFWDKEHNQTIVEYPFKSG